MALLLQGADGELGDGYDEGVRHAETPELAREALADCAVLIFKGQVEVAFREQTAGHNALLLFVHLALSMMEERLTNAFKELRAKEAEVQCCRACQHAMHLLSLNCSEGASAQETTVTVRRAVP